MIYFLLFVLLVLHSCASDDSQKMVQSRSQISDIQDSVPIIVLRSYFNEKDNISFSNLYDGLISGRIVCTSNVVFDLKERLKLEQSPQVIRLKDFVTTDSSSFLITTIDSVIPSLLVTSIDGIHFLRSRERYPLWISATSGYDYNKCFTSYTHTGVTALTRRTGTALNAMGNLKYLELIRPVLGNPDILHISNEVSISPNCNYSEMKMKFATRLEHFELLNILGADVIELTGNHNLDFGSSAYESTMLWYKDNGMKVFGGGITPEQAAAPLILTMKDSSKVAWIGFNEFCPCGECADKTMGANRFQRQAALESIQSIRNMVDYVIACVQFGETDSYTPSGSQKNIARFLIDSGADVVIGSQAHQPQTFECYQGKMIFYGIGNFMFDQIHRLGVRQAYFLECYFFQGRIIQFIPHFTFMGDDRRPAPANDAQTRAIKSAVYRAEYFLGK